MFIVLSECFISELHYSSANFNNIRKPLRIWPVTHKPANRHLELLRMTRKCSHEKASKGKARYTFSIVFYCRTLNNFHKILTSTQ